MPITAEQAADIARAHGLNLADALALQQLADTPAEAAHLATKYGNRDRAAAQDLRDKSHQLLDLWARTDSDGHVAPPAPASGRPIEQLRSGAHPADPSPNLLDRIRDAELSGDNTLARTLKAELIDELNLELNG